MALATVVLAGCAPSSGETDLRERVVERLEAAEEPADFEFRFRAAGTRVNDCFLPNREFVGEVRADRGLLVIRPARGEEPMIASTGEATFLHRRLFEEDSVPAEWVRLAERGPAVAEALNRVLGADLAGYVVSESLPPSGNSTALAVLRAAEDVTPVGGSTIGDVRAERLRVTIDPEDYEAGLGQSTRRADESGGPPPEVDFWITPDDEVVRVEVRPAAEPGSEEPPPGWVIDYSVGVEAVAIEPPADALVLDRDEVAALSPPRLASCEVAL